MKRFVIRLVLEFIVIATTTIVATQLVKSGYLALGVSILSVYAMFNLCRLAISKIDTQYRDGINKTQQELLKGRLTTVTAQMRRLELALVEAASEALWVSSVTEDDETVYVIETPNHGCFVIMTPADDATKTEDVPRNVRKG